jgi:hypothetical protein
MVVAGARRMDASRCQDGWVCDGAVDVARVLCFP